jgi:integrase
MGADLAAAYIGLSETTLRAVGPKPREVGKRRLYDRIDLDRWADRLGGQPLTAHERGRRRPMSSAGSWRSAVPEDRPKFTYVVKGRYWRFRRGGLKAPLPGKPGQAIFAAEYARLLALSERKPDKPDESSLAWLIGQYRASAEFAALRAPTQLDYGKTLDLIEADDLAQEPYALITGPMVKAVRDEHAKTPRKAHKIKQTISRLYSWAQEAGKVPQGCNPAASFKRLKVRSKSIAPWSEEEIALFLAHCPAELKTPFLLALCTGQRPEDAVTMEWTAYQGAFIRVRQSKTDEMLDIACHPDLRAHLDSVRTSFGGRIARTALKRPYSANGFAQHIRRVAEKIDGFPSNRSPHGLRYAAAGRLEEVGVTPGDASSVLGHRTYQMAMKYLSQRKRSAASMAKVASKAGTKC